MIRIMTKNKSAKTGKAAVDELFTETEADNEPDPVRLVIHLKQRMKERNLTQTQLAEMSGVRQATISQLSRGHVEKIHVPTLEKIAAAMHITDISQLITFEVESEIMGPSNPFDIETE
ncbi:helix-turn-helix domain-containing protein [Alteribacillus sp. JSM 102045]|uniref:helix-turn-helix domain-containing protein n=1 Tax=Alteribacillus sp. JSM 102045 TaxID=1562101 RepID=UPI0035BF2A45